MLKTRSPISGFGGVFEKRVGYLTVKTSILIALLGQGLIVAAQGTEQVTYQGLLNVGKYESTINYLGEESGDLAVFCFKNKSAAGRAILAKCQHRTKCEFTGYLQWGDCRVTSDASATDRIVSIKSVRRIKHADVPAQDRASLDAGREFTRMFYARQFEHLWEKMADNQRRELGSIENLSKFRTTVDELVGEEIKVLGEEIAGAAGQDVYIRRIRYEKSAEPFDLKWTINGEGRITDFSIRPARPAIEFNYRTKTLLRLPFDGEWYVGSGGRTPEQNANHHYDYLSRFDSDFVRVEDARLDKNANPPRNEDFTGFGKPILAPAPGTVAMLRDGIPDNIPSQVNLKPEERAGNFVVINHGNGEYSFLSHLKKGSITVRAGQKLAAGRKVGECGNSGNSSGPHLHYGLRRAARPDKGMSVPAQFTTYLADGKLIKRGEVRQGQKIKTAK